MSKSVIIPQADLDKLEEIRKTLWGKYGTERTGISSLVELQKITEGLWLIANRKYPPIHDEGCSVCGTKPALCADKFDKGTYFLCSGCLSERTTENGRLNQALDDLAEDCPTCDNSGLTIVGRQCEYCYANKLSTFNINVLKIQAITGKERYDVIRDFIRPDSELDT